jgi:hypothetical protein
MDRTMSVPGYVEVAFDDVLDAFSDEATIAELLDAAVVDAFPAGSIVQLQASPPALLTRWSARVKLAWRFVDPRGHPFEGEAAVQLLVLQSGNEPLTELLVTMRIDDVYATAVATAVHRFLDVLVARLARATIH